MFRHQETPEQIEMHAHEGECHYCLTEGPNPTPGIVKMTRSLKTFTLEPDRCYCLLCGQRYYVVTDDIMAWELRQSQQKPGE